MNGAPVQSSLTDIGYYIRHKSIRGLFIYALSCQEIMSDGLLLISYEVINEVNAYGGGRIHPNMEATKRISTTLY
jgi:hypothetical protein